MIEFNYKISEVADMKMKLRKALILVCVLVFTYVSVNAISIWNYSRTDEKQAADVAIVLGAGTADDEVSPVFRERINHGIWLYRNGYVEKIIMTGGYGDGNEYSDAFVAKMYAQSEGIPEADILLEEESTITQENIENAKEIMDYNQYSTAVLVSDPLHMKRAMLMAADYGIDAYSSPTPTSMYRSMTNKLKFLAREVFFYVGYKVYRVF